MKGYLTSYASLFQANLTGPSNIVSVEIPIIQRDYAQGRREATVDEIRITFLEVLLGAIAGGEPLGLDFVYGRVDEGTLRPLDGQQRLTTLFLLHWYLASAADGLDSAATWNSFSYSTRPSARLFCQRLGANPLPKGEYRPSAWITDQPWYLYVWRNDPTIQAMLVMVDAIHDESRRLHPGLDLVAAWERLIDTDRPAVWFYLLPLADMESDEDLYIKMNSRGKPLTVFEAFKARFEQDIEQSHRADEFAQKVDGAWSDLLWPIHGGDDLVDDEFVRYLGFLTEICELRDGQVLSGRLGPRARARFGATNKRAHEHLDFIFDGFDKWQSADHVKTTFDQVLSTRAPGGAQYDSRKVLLFGGVGTNLFEQCCHRFDNQWGGSFTLQQRLLLYAFLLHVIHDTDDFPQRLRVLRNLIAASEDQVRRPNMPALIKDIEALIIRGDLAAVRAFSSNQLQDERLKREFLDESPDLEDALFRLEDHSILRGCLSAFEFEAETFRDRAEAFEAAFTPSDIWLGLTGALLATGDYQRQRPNSAAWQFGTSSPTNEGVWRYLLTNAPRSSLAATRMVLAKYLDELVDSGQGAKAHFDTVMNAWLAERANSERFDWRYYLVKYPSMRGGDSGIYYGVSGQLGYSMCMLRKIQRNSYNRDPILLELWGSSGVGDRVSDPWFTGYETNPRWLRLVRSGAGLRSVASGLALQKPQVEGLESVFIETCERHGIVEIKGNAMLLRIPQHEQSGTLIDSVDRIVVGGELLRALVEAGL